MAENRFRRGLLVGWVAAACVLALVASLAGLLYALRARPDEAVRPPTDGISVDDGALR